MDKTVTKQPLQTIVAVEQDDMGVRALAVVIRILDENPDFDIKQAVKDACLEYVKTETGRKTYDYNCSGFNWADFASGEIPNEICKNHGFELVKMDMPSLDVDWDEQLVDEPGASETEE